MHAGVLVEQLPHDSRTFAAENPSNAWDEKTWLLHWIEYACRVLVWQRTKDGEKGTNKPKPGNTPLTRPKKDVNVEQSARQVASVLGIEGMV